MSNMQPNPDTKTEVTIMKMIFTTLAILLAVGFLGSQAAYAHWGNRGYTHQGFNCFTPARLRVMADRDMGYGRMGQGMKDYGRHGYMRGRSLGSCWRTPDRIH